ADMSDAPNRQTNLTTSYRNAPTRTVTAGGVDFAYRELGQQTATPVIFLTHLAANLDNWDPRVVDGIAAKHRAITFDNRGVGASSGTVPDTIEAMERRSRVHPGDPVRRGRHSRDLDGTNICSSHC